MKKRSVKYFKKKRHFKFMGKLLNIVDDYQLAELKLQMFRSKSSHHIDIDALGNVKLDLEEKIKT